MTEKIRFGVIGAGRIGRIHVENLCYNVPDAEVAGISEVEASLPATKEWAKKFGIANIVSDPMVLISIPILMPLPSVPHRHTCDLIIACAEAGKAIFCEKPIANDVEKTREALKR